MVVCTPIVNLPSAGRPSLASGVARHGCSHGLLTAPCPSGLLTSALCSIPPVVRSLTSFALWCGLAGRLGIASPSSGKLPEARLFTPCTRVVRFHSPQTSTQSVWVCTPGVVFGRPRLGTVVKQRRKRTGWASRETVAPHPLFLE